MEPNSIGELFRTKESDAFRIFLPVHGGVLPGYQYTSKKWIEAKTFISDEMLKQARWKSWNF